MDGTVLVTGAGGFVGSAVVRLLVRSMESSRPRFSDGAPVRHVVAVVRPGGNSERLQELPQSSDWSIAYADLTDRSGLRQLLGRIRPRAILHLAVDQHIHGDLSEAERYRVNIAPLETLFEGLRDTPGARLIHTSSAWVLPAGQHLDESVSPVPQLPYAETKAMADRMLAPLQAVTGVPWINLRLFNIFGKYEAPSRLLPYIVSHLARGEVAELSCDEQTRDFTDVDQIARAYLLALEADEGACGAVYHIGSGRGTRIRDFAMMVAKETGNAHLIRFGVGVTRDRELAVQVADPTRAKRLLRWYPGEDLEERIHQTANWWLERWGIRSLHLAA